MMQLTAGKNKVHPGGKTMAKGGGVSLKVTFRANISFSTQVLYVICPLI